MAEVPDEWQQDPRRDRETPQFGDRVVSWSVAEAELYPEPDEDYDRPPLPNSDEDAAEMQRLRGLIMVQASEVEAVPGVILGKGLSWQHST